MKLTLSVPLELFREQEPLEPGSNFDIVFFGKTFRYKISSIHIDFADIQVIGRNISVVTIEAEGPFYE